MKTLLIILILIPSTSYLAFGQDSLNHKNCSDLIYKTVKAHIFGDNPDSTIKLSNVNTGFKLVVNDTLYKIEKYFIVFEYGEDLIELHSQGEKIIPEMTDFGRHLKRITPGSLMTVEGIIVTKNERCYKLSPLIYHITE